MKIDVTELENWQIVPTEYLNDKNLSLKAIGLLTKLYSLPNNWEFSMNGFCAIFKEGITAIRNAFAELEYNGYISRYETRNNEGKFEYVYKIHVHKFKVDKTKNCTSLRRFKTAIRTRINKENRV